MSFRDFAVGEVLTAGNLKTYVQRQAGKPLVVVRKSATQSLANGAAGAALTWDIEDADTDSIHSTTSFTSRMTIVTPGVYVPYASIEFAANATGIRDVWFAANGSGTYFKNRDSGPVGTANTFVNASGPIGFNLVTGDHIECWGAQTSGGALNVATGSYFALVYFSAA